MNFFVSIKVVRVKFVLTVALTLSYTGFFRLVLHGEAQSARGLLSKMVKATVIKPGTLTN